MIIKYCDKEFLIYNEIDLKNIFFIIISTYFNLLNDFFLSLKTVIIINYKYKIHIIYKNIKIN